MVGLKLNRSSVGVQGFIKLKRFGEYNLKICVLGAGAWGTALAIHLGKLHPTKLWARNSGHVSGMKKAQSNPLYLGDFKFPPF